MVGRRSQTVWQTSLLSLNAAPKSCTTLGWRGPGCSWELGFFGQACALLLTSSECWMPLFLGRNFVTKCPELAMTLKLKTSWGKGEGGIFKCPHKIAHPTLVQKCWVQGQRRKISISLNAKAKGNVGKCGLSSRSDWRCEGCRVLPRTSLHQLWLLLWVGRVKFVHV